jgi:hypothetical protein
MKRVLLFTALIVWSTLASAVVYKWTDASGKVQYGDRPPDGVKAELVEGLGTHPSMQGPAPVRAAAPAAAPAPARDNKAKEAVEADLEAARAQHCTDAQARYKQLIEGRHMYKAGANGERDYMTSEEIDAARLAAKQDIDSSCGS